VVSWQGSFQFGIDFVRNSRRNLDAPQDSSSVVRSADRCGDVRTYKPTVALTKEFYRDTLVRRRTEESHTT
jgi:hypothetical protein